MQAFLDVQPTTANHWRSLILFGRNVASYKFALARSLLEMADRRDDFIRLDELAAPFSRHLCEHVAASPKQATSPTSKFLDACRLANAGTLPGDQLRDLTVRLGFTNVIDAFHRLGPADLPIRFFMDERAQSRGIRITDELRGLVQMDVTQELTDETEARWRLVETAWELGVSHPLIEHDAEQGSLAVRRRDRRAAVTSVRAALNGYQKGCCFYCFGKIAIVPGPTLADVDHFLPWSTRAHIGGNVDGVWNLVLSCQACNRGPAGKHDLVPALGILHRLHTRNEFLILSHHPLRETLMMQTGLTSGGRASFLQNAWGEVALQRGARWEPIAVAARAF
ncbi:HNH endonuclease [Erythrobacter arachoides]|uniref:HNH endonuclease n=1 Tax=Aurantiacibacter arachoides TaxID=1850444 RepID=A0A845A568_9SPHN|nr:HNH endonuclease [Aurantiacibacter arachoides]